VDYHILIVEDDVITSTILSKYLQNAGYVNTYCVESSEECFEFLEKQKPDVILMDINLKSENEGIYAADKIHKKFSIPIIFITANQAEKTMQLARLTEPYAYLIKPINPKELFSSIEIALYKHKAENELKFERDKLSVVTNSIGVGISIISKDFKVVWANDVYKKLYGQRVGEKCYFFAGKKHCANCSANSVFNGETNWAEREMSIELKEGKKRKKAWVQIITTPILDDSYNVNEVLEVIVPITDKKRMEASLKENIEIKGLTAHLEKVREEEKTIISREIHDELGQALTALKFDVAWLSKKLKPSDEVRKIGGIEEKLDTMVEMLNSTLKTMRRITSDLRPGILDDLGLVASIEWYLNEFANRTPMNCNIKILVKEINLEDIYRTAFYRIVQEIMTNVARHSQATVLKVFLTENKKNYVLFVSDNGVGIPPEKEQNSTSYGLIGIKERCVLLGGNVKIKSAIGKGTKIEVRVPKKIRI